MVIKRKFVRDQEKMKYWQSMIVLNYILNVRSKALPVVFDSDDNNKELEPLLVKLYEKRMLEIENNQYVPTKLGREALAQFLEKYHEMNNAFGVFQAICLNPVNRDAGETNFALEKLYELSEDDYLKFRNDSKWRWEDLRLAVIEFKNSRITDPEKKIDPVEMVVMNFLEKNRFDYEKKDWQFDLRAGLLWDEIYEIAESLLGVNDLTYTDMVSGGVTNGEDVIRDIVEQGTEIMQKIFKKKLQLEKEEEERFQRMKEEERLLEEERMQEEDRQWRQQRANSGYQEFVEYDYGERVVFRDLDPFDEVVVVRTTVEYMDPFFVPPVLVISIW